MLFKPIYQKYHFTCNQYETINKIANVFQTVFEIPCVFHIYSTSELGLAECQGSVVRVANHSILVHSNASPNFPLAFQLIYLSCILRS